MLPHFLLRHIGSRLYVVIEAEPIRTVSSRALSVSAVLSVLARVGGKARGKGEERCTSVRSDILVAASVRKSGDVSSTAVYI